MLALVKVAVAVAGDDVMTSNAGQSPTARRVLSASVLTATLTYPSSPPSSHMFVRPVPFTVRRGMTSLPSRVVVIKFGRAPTGLPEGDPGENGTPYTPLALLTGRCLRLGMIYRLVSESVEGEGAA